MGKAAKGEKDSPKPKDDAKSEARTKGSSGEDPEQAAGEFRKAFRAMEDEIGKRIVGNAAVVRRVLTALFAGGNILLEGVPGIGKTQLVKSLASVAGVDFSRIQFTPDLMPADIVGTQMIVEGSSGERRVEFQKGPIFANVVLADEINRATPKTQSALLEDPLEDQAHEIDICPFGNDFEACRIYCARYHQRSFYTAG